MRILTVSTVHREWGPNHRRGHGRVAALRLNGKWLEALGYLPGARVCVKAVSGALVITRSAT